MNIFIETFLRRILARWFYNPFQTDWDYIIWIVSIATLSYAIAGEQWYPYFAVIIISRFIVALARR